MSRLMKSVLRSANHRSMGTGASLSLLAAALLAGPLAVDVTAQTEAQKDAAETGKARGPVARVDSSVHNFGEVWTNQTLEHAFVITNVGDKPLKILQVKPSCGCTVAGPYPREIKPGESGDFPFRLNSSRLHGKFSKSISIKTSDPKKGQMRLSLTGRVKHFIEATPNIAQFGRVQSDTVRTKTIKIKNNTNKKMKLTLSPQMVESKTFNAELNEVTPGILYELKVTAQPPYQPKLNRHLVKIDTNLDEQKSIDIICMANYPPRVEFMPDSIVVRPVSRDVIRKVRVRNNGEQAVNVLSAKADDEAIKVETRPIQAGKQYELTITIPAEYEPATASNPTILVKTDDAEMPELRLPIRTVRKSSAKQAKRPAELLRGKPAPTHQFVTIDKKQHSVGGSSDKVKVLAFYASWCGFCKRALPKMQTFYDKYKDKNIDMVLINVDDRGNGRRARTEAQTLKHYQDMKLSIPMHMDSAKKITPSYRVVSYPTLFVVGKTGVIEDVLMGAQADLDRRLAKDVDMLLAGKSIIASKGGNMEVLVPNLPERRSLRTSPVAGAGEKLGTRKKIINGGGERPVEKKSKTTKPKP